MLSLQFPLCVSFLSVLHTNLQGPSTLEFISHLSIVVFSLIRQVRTGLSPAVVTNTVLVFPEEKKREHVRRSPGVVVWTLQGNVCSGTNKCEATAVFICTLFVISYYSSGLWSQWPIMAYTNFPLRIILVDKTGYWRRTLLLPIVFSSSTSKDCACTSKSSRGLLTGLKYRNMTIASGHMIVAFLCNCCCQKSKLVLLHSYQKSNPGQRLCLYLSGITQAHITMVELCAGGKDFASCLRVFWHVHYCCLHVQTQPLLWGTCETERNKESDVQAVIQCESRWGNGTFVSFGFCRN